MKLNLKKIITAILLCLANFVLISAQTMNDTSAYYVSRNGDNTDGLTWQSAWEELDQINWDVIEAGDTIYIDGDQTRMFYETELSIEKSGEEDAPIRIQVSPEDGHNGQVVFFGGRETLLPYCGQEVYDNTGEENYREYGIRTQDNDYLIIDGNRWHGIQINGYRANGVRIDAGSEYVTIRNLEIFNNGDALQSNGTWRSDNAGLRLGGMNITLERMVIHDNGQDAIQSLSGNNNISNFRLEQSWLYNGRQHPTVNESANYCTHTDGIQVYAGGTISGISITESVIGPGFTQNVILGQTPNENGSQAVVNDVVFRDVLFTKGADNNVLGYRETDSHNWLLDRVTIHCPNTKSHCLHIQNSDHRVVDSIVVDGQITFFDDLDNFDGNCVWNTTGFSLGREVDPNFARVSDASFSIDDYTVDPDSACIGSRITSVQQLYDLTLEEQNRDE